MANEQCSIFDFADDEYIYKINKPIRLIEFFAGVGAQHKALTNLKANFESYKICEWALSSIIGYNAIHLGNFNGIWDNETDKNKIAQFLYEKGVSLNYNEPATLEQLKRVDMEKLKQCANSIINLHNLVDISRVKGNTLEIVDKDKYTYMLTYSYPCVTANTLVLSDKGYIPFKEISIGDKVLTKSNTWQTVVKQFDNGVNDIYRLDASGTAGIECTKEHKFYVREMYRKGHKAIRCFKNPEMVHAKDLTKSHYLGIPVIKDEIPFYTEDVNFWYLIGMYLGDGWLNKSSKDIRFGFNDEKIKKFSKLGFSYSIYDNKIGCKHLRIANKDVYNFIEKYIGTGSNDKHIPVEILKLPKKQLQSLYDGYLATDGCVIGNKHQFSSINEKMSYSVLSIIHKLFHRPAFIYKVKVTPKKIIQGREVNQKAWYQIRFKLNTSKQDKAFYEDDYIWFPFRSLTYLRQDHVYNMEIENDHSYIINGVISANCQDLSSAGKQAGQVEGSGTRSSLLWEVGRILKECKESNSLPQVLLMENVPNCHGTKNIKEWHKWLETLELLGYKNFWQDLNSKDYGIPQTRNRCYMVSILKESDKPIIYNFPKKKRLNLLLKDLLESNVDEKYYLSDKLITCFSGVNQKESKFPRGERFAQALEKTNNSGVANTITTCAGNIVTDNFIIDDTINENLKTKLCNELIATGKVKEYDVIRHSYSNSRLQDWDKRNTEQNNISPTLDTRCDCLGVVVNTDNKRLNETLSQSDIQGGCFIDAYNKKVNKDIAGTITTRVSESNCTFVACNDGVVIPENTKKGYAIAKDGGGVYINRPEQKRGTVQKGMIPTLTTCPTNDVGVVVKEPNYLGTYQYSKSDKFMHNKERYKPNKECADTIQTTQKEGIVETSPRLLGGFGNKCNNDTQYHTQNRIYDDKMAVALNTGFNPYYYNNLRIRKLTPLECFRLMAFSDEDYYKMKQYLSDSKLYHCMGDSIVVKVLEDIFRELIEPSNHNITIPLW